MGQFISILVLGIANGLVLFLLASGMTLTMGLLRVVNMSHGAMYMFAGYCGVWVYQVTGSWVIAVLSGGVVGGLLGLFLETCFLRRLYKTPANQVLLTIGFINIIQNITQWIWGGNPTDAPIPEFLRPSVQVGSAEIQYFRFFVIAFGIIICAAIWLMQDKTKIGAMVRAGMDNSEIASTLGLNNRKIFTFIFVLGSAIAGLTSLLGGRMTGLSMGTGWSILLKAIIVVVVGGAGSIPGALIAGLFLGIVDAFGQGYFSMLSSYLFYIVLIIVLVIRPQGIMGRKMDVDKASDDYSNMTAAKARSFTPAMLEGTGVSGAKVMTYKLIPYIFVLAVLVVLPLVTGTYTTTILTKVLVYALFAMSLDVVMGYTGNRSFGHAAFFGMGGYTVGLLLEHFDFTNFWLVLLITIVVCAVLSAIIGWFTLRLSGTNFLLVTMAFGQLLSSVASKWSAVTNGADGIVGIKRPDFGEFLNNIVGKWTGTKFYFFVLIVFVICFLLLHRFMRSSFGHTLLSIRGNEGRMRALGYNTWSLKYTGVILAGVFAGIAGLLYAYTYKNVTPDIFALESSALPMLMVIMGGGATLWGPALGAAVIILVKNYAGIWMPERWPLILGALYVVCVMFLKNGFAPHLRRLWDWVGTKFFAKELAKKAEAKEG